VRLVRDAFPGLAAFELAVTEALLRRAGRGDEPPTLRVFRPPPTVAFGRLDALRPGYPQARDAARDHGYEPVLRLGGGHAAAFDTDSVVIDEITRVPVIAEGLTERFERMTGLLAGALAALGADARVGELPGEYCAGAWSVNLGGRIKVGGTAQRVVSGAALVTAVVVAGGGARIRAVLADVYEALELEWDPATAGAVEDELPGAGADAVAEAVLDAYGPTEPGGLDDATLALASRLEPHRRGTPE